jgi:hypothetical protein
MLTSPVLPQCNNRVSNPHHLSANPHPAPNQSDDNLRPLVYITSRVPISVCGSGSGSDAFLTPGSGMRKKSGSGSGMNDPDDISESLETISLG